MVRLGLIVEGDSEFMLFNSAIFQEYISTFENIDLIGVLNAEGIGNFVKEGSIVGSHVEILEDSGVDKIIMLLDLEDESCVTLAKQNVYNYSNKQIIVIAKRAFEAWLLADSISLSKLMKTNISFWRPEETIKKPFEEYKDLLLQLTGRGIGGKILLVGKIMLNDFTFEECNNHKNCLSLKYFFEKLNNL